MFFNKDKSNSEQNDQVLKVKVKKLVPEAVIPTRSYSTDAGLDLTATSYGRNPYTGADEYGTGLAIEIPEGHIGLIFPRSSIFKKAHLLANSVGVIDPGYQGEIKFFFKHTDGDGKYQVGNRIGQLVVLPFPKVELEEVQELSVSVRGENGFGSSGK